ncbi:winged helix-turn-helix transcriptional regulator [Sulfitobacter faviae]|uniref:winged helix-turn-helix transcriptional regulator n=2 Tax=Sulfitobacter TaxID=60136 RepID=UPI001F082512|nr:helix-turn-helix domain-containing protein [Sulfitobacter faviae]
MESLKMKQKTPPACPMDSILRLLMGPWTTYILWVLSDGGPQRFGALKRAVPGISTRMLTERLRMLQAAGVIWRDQTQTIPPAVTYGMTERGDDLRQVLEALGEIAQRWQAEGAFEKIEVAAK